MPDRSLREEELLVRVGWIVKVRWLFLAVLAVTIVTGRYAFGIRFPVGRVLLVGAVVLLYNLGFDLYQRFRKRRSPPDLTVSRIEAYLQIGMDLTALTFLIHFSGGAENPFIYFYLFHAILASMLLPRREVWLLGLVSYAMFLSVLALEYLEVVPHYPLEGLFSVSRHRDLPFLTVVSTGLLITLVITIYMSCTIVGSLKLREAKLVLTRNMLEKKSRELAEANAKLVERQKQLVQAEKLASMGQLVSGIAHEINNPIQFIQGNMQILREAIRDVLPLLDEKEETAGGLKVARLPYPFFREQVQVLLKDMAEGAGRIGNIVRDLKTFARRDEGRLDEQVDVNRVIETAIRLVHNKIKRFRLEQSLAEGLPAVKGSMIQLEQVAVNTLINAAEALESRPDACIRVSTQLENGGRQVRMSISDNGPGMTDEVKDRLFDPFFTTKQRIGGTGLGMSITYGIIEEHGGSIEVDSRPGEGTTFHYILPVARSKP
ncbi:MAG TPA: ATP-binding protein [Candidatus Aquicultoraceae bacterium]|nr:ATP-binding protein [Candidatus Aquicultoraceae bacterium]